jgi:tetratricopeptide (TPR) repeat protein
MMIFISFLFAVVFAFLALLALNYSIYKWENQKVSDLTSQIKPSGDTTLSTGGSFAKNFSSVDLGNTLQKSRAIQVAGNIYDRAIVTISNQDYPTWLTKIFEEINLFRKNAWKSLSRLFGYLLSLTKPASREEVNNFTAKSTQHAKKMEDIGQTIEKVNKINTLPADQLDSDEVEFVSEAMVSEQIRDVDYKTPGADEDDDLATISFAGSATKKSNSDMTVFEKLEARILEKLKTSGFNNYDIWLELGNLYEKYDEKEKAGEIYALVLKHSEGREKDLARDKLIGLS